MFGIGTPELLVIIFVAVLLLKPEDVPRLMRRFGELYGRLIRMYHAVLDEVQSFEDMAKK